METFSLTDTEAFPAPESKSPSYSDSEEGYRTSVRDSDTESGIISPPVEIEVDTRGRKEILFSYLEYVITNINVGNVLWTP